MELPENNPFQLPKIIPHILPPPLTHTHTNYTIFPHMDVSLILELYLQVR